MLVVNFGWTSSFLLIFKIRISRNRISEVNAVLSDHKWILHYICSFDMGNYQILKEELENKQRGHFDT